MKLTLRNLRSLIVESLNEQDLDERAMTSGDAGNDLALCVEQKHNMINLVLYRYEAFKKDLEEGYSSKTLKKHVVAMLFAMQRDFNNPFFEVQLTAAEKGWGPFMYDKAMSLVGGLMPDRFSITPAAKKIWDHYYHDRSDVKVTPLDKYDVKMRGDEVLDCGYQLKGSGPNTSALEERHNPEWTYNVVESARQYFLSRS